MIIWSPRATRPLGIDFAFPIAALAVFPLKVPVQPGFLPKKRVSARGETQDVVAEETRFYYIV